MTSPEKALAAIEETLRLECSTELSLETTIDHLATLRAALASADQARVAVLDEAQQAVGIAFAIGVVSQAISQKAPLGKVYRVLAKKFADLSCHEGPPVPGNPSAP